MSLTEKLHTNDIKIVNDEKKENNINSNNNAENEDAHTTMSKDEERMMLRNNLTMCLGLFFEQRMLACHPGKIMCKHTHN